MTDNKRDDAYIENLTDDEKQRLASSIDQPLSVFCAEIDREREAFEKAMEMDTDAVYQNE